METLSLSELKATLTQQILHNRMDSLKTGIPAILFTVQTNLVYLAISNLDAAVFQVTFQIKILTLLLRLLKTKVNLEIKKCFNREYKRKIIVY